jgi:hypothetical protein
MRRAAEQAANRDRNSLLVPERPQTARPAPEPSGLWCCMTRDGPRSPDGRDGGHDDTPCCVGPRDTEDYADDQLSMVSGPTARSARSALTSRSEAWRRALRPQPAPLRLDSSVTEPRWSASAPHLPGRSPRHVTASGFTHRLAHNFARDGDRSPMTYSDVDARPRTGSRTYADLEARLNAKQFKLQERNLHRNARNSVAMEEAVMRMTSP